MYLLEGIIDFPEGQGVKCIILVIGYAADAAAAVIPKNENLMIRAVIFFAKGKKGGQRFFIPHACLRQLCHQLKFSFVVKVAADVFGADVGPVPFAGPPGLNDHLHIIRQASLEQFCQIGRGRAVF